MNPNIFREFSIRGIADKDLTDDVVILIGRAIGRFLEKRQMKSLTLGKDVRNSSARMGQALITGLLQVDIEVIDVGVVPTPVHNFATDLYKTDLGVMITASHNPPEYNGFKIRLADRSLRGDEVQEIYDLVLNASVHSMESSTQKQKSWVDPIPTYLERLKMLSDFPATFSLQPLKVVVDGGNGTNGRIVGQLLRDLGVHVVELHSEPNGDFPGRGPDPTSPGAMDELSNLVESEQANLGVAYDGDGDRLVLVDERGNQVLGDQIMMILARDILRHGPAKIVYEILCTQALADDILAHSGEPIMTPSGYAFVHQAIHESDAALGGELSGHLFFNQPDFRFDDPILATVKLLNILVNAQNPLSDLIADLPAYYSSPQVRIPCPDAVKPQIVAYVRKEFEQDYKVETIDGARIHFPDGWAMVRQSNTQPVISMRFEARSPEQLAVIQTKVQTLVEAEIRRQTYEEIL